MGSMQGDLGSTPPQDDGRLVASIVVPAHNEAAVLGRLLENLPTHTQDGRIQIIVACNGCTDDTAQIARKYGATVVEVEQASKIAALNAADEVAVAFPRLYVDADVVLTPKTIADLIAALSEPGALCAAPPYRLVLEGRPWIIRAYFAVWQRLMAMRNGYVGSGVYALSAKGRARFDRFPNVVADDTYVRNLFTRSERRVIATDPTVVQAPWTVQALVRRRIRVTIGNLELMERPDYRRENGESTLPWWRAVLAEPRLIPAGVVYAVINSFAELSARRQIRSKSSVKWERDETTRSASA